MKASPIRLVALLAKSMFVAGALGLASLLPNNAKAVPTEWSSIADIIAQAPEGFRILTFLIFF